MRKSSARDRDSPPSSHVETTSRPGNGRFACVSTQHEKTYASPRRDLRSSCIRCTNRARPTRSRSSSVPSRWTTRSRHSTISPARRRSIRRSRRSRAPRAAHSNRSRGVSHARMRRSARSKTTRRVRRRRSKRRRPNAGATSRRSPQSVHLNETQIARLDSRAQVSVERTLAVSAAAGAPVSAARESRRRTAHRGGAHADGRRDRLHGRAGRPPRPLDRLGTVAVDPVGDPAGDANDDPRLRPGRRRGHRRGRARRRRSTCGSRARPKPCAGGAAW